MKTPSQYLYDFERFGLTPTKICARINGSSAKAPRILSISMPKSGTNLLQRILILHPFLSRAWLPTLGRRNTKIWSDPLNLFSQVKNGKIVSSHFDYDSDLADLFSNKLEFKLLLMVRDPRDAVISDMHYIKSWPGHPLKNQIMSLPDDKSRLLALIEGRKGLRNIHDQILRFSRWKECAHTIRFEDAIGADGGGSDDKQFEVIKGMFDYLKMQVSDEEARLISANARSGKTQTFRTGRIRNWETVFDNELKDAFRLIAGDLLIDLGYETGMDW